MAVVQIRHVRRRYTRGDNERIEMSGAVQATGNEGSVPAGSFQLGHVDQIIIGPSTGMANGSAFASRRGLAGSVRDPLTTHRNTVRLRTFITGTTGTRTASGPSVIGSVPAAGAVSAPFVVFGH